MYIWWPGETQPRPPRSLLSCTENQDPWPGPTAFWFEWFCKHIRLRPEPIRFVRLDSGHVQSDRKSVNRRLSVLDLARGCVSVADQKDRRLWERDWEKLKQPSPPVFTLANLEKSWSEIMHNSIYGLYTCIFPHLLMSVAELDGKGESSNTSGSLGLLLLTVVVELK